MSPLPFSIQLVQEFLEETLAQRGIDVVPQTFHMDSLLQEMREIESARHSSLPPIPAPGVAQALADGVSTGWADQFSEMPSKHFDVSKNLKVFMSCKLLGYLFPTKGYYQGIFNVNQ